MVELPWRTLFKVIAAGALVWAWLQIWQLALLVVVAVLLAVALDPVVSWVQSRGLPRWGAATLVCVALLALDEIENAFLSLRQHVAQSLNTLGEASSNEHCYRLSFRAKSRNPAKLPLR